MSPFLSTYLSFANNPKTPIPTTDRPKSTFYEDAIRLVKFYFRVVLTLTVDLMWLEYSVRVEPLGRKLLATLLECVKCFHTVGLIC